MSSNLVQLFEHNLWANKILFELCIGLDDQVLDSTVEGGFGTIRETLRHIASAESLYSGFLTSPRPDEARAEKASLETLAGAREVVERYGQALIQHARDTPADTILEGERGDGYAYRYPASFVFLQAINHSTEHRTQIATILTQKGVEPPELDGWTYLYGVLLAQGSNE